jgi:lipopolysaccharide biosynthesis glycosyltransferase
MMVAGELPKRVLARMRALNVTLVPVEPLEVPNLYEPRFAKNWLKIRALELEQYDAVLLMDADTAVVGDVSELFSLGAPFAAALDQPGVLHQEKTVRPMFQGGVFFLRPCPAVAAHMLELLARYPKLRFAWGNAEQEFFTWYFRHTAVVLPTEYNTMTYPSLRGNLTTGGVPPRIVHFTSNKPFKGPEAGSAGHQYLCEGLDA